jgi:hypothetical protein
LCQVSCGAREARAVGVVVDVAADGRQRGAEFGRSLGLWGTRIVPLAVTWDFRQLARIG